MAIDTKNVIYTGVALTCIGVSKDDHLDTILGEINSKLCSTGGSVSSVAISSTDLSVSGSPITSSGTFTLNINSHAVTYAKIQSVGASKLVGNPTGASANVSEISLGTGLAFSGTTIYTPSNSTNQKVNIEAEGISIGTRKSINLIQGSNVTISAVDNSTDDRIDVTINSSGSGGGGTSPGGSTTQLQYNNSGAFGGTAAGIYNTSGNLFVYPAQTSTDVPLTIKGAGSQTGDLQRWQNSISTTLAKIDSAGNITGTNLSGINTGDQTITLTGNVTGSGTGSFATTIAANAVLNTNIRQSTGLSVIGRSGNTTGNVADIASSIDGSVLRQSGTAIGWGQIVTTGIADANITYAKIQNATGQTLLGRYINSTGTIQEVTIGSGLALNTSTGILTATAAAGGTVTSIALSGSNGIGVSGSPITTNGTITLSLGNITPTTVNALTFASQAVGFTIAGGTSSKTLTVSNTANISGTNTGDVTLAGQTYLSIAGQVITANPITLSGTHVTGTLAAARMPALTGDVTTSVGTVATTIANSAVTYAKIQNITTQKLLGRYAGTNGVMQEITLGAGLSLDTSTGTLTSSGGGGGSCFDTLSTFAGAPNTTIVGTNYISLNGASFSSGIADRVVVIPSSGYIKNLFVIGSGTQGASTLTFTLMKSSTDIASMANTALVLTIANGAAAGTGTKYSNTSDSVAVNAGDILVLKAASTATSFKILGISMLFTNQ